MFAAVTRPLAPGDRAQARWFDGTSSARAVAKLIKPSATLRPIERVEIYNRMYWFRLLECIATDFPGLRALLGDERFWKLAEAYLRAHPSRSFTLRNLGAKLPRFVAQQSKWTKPHTEAASDLARFEWAQILAFDDVKLAPLTKKKLAGLNPETLRLRVQPYLTLLTCHHAVDDYTLAVKNDNALRAEASNAVTERTVSDGGKVALTRTKPLHIVVHRLDNQLYYKRLEPEAARLLRALAAGRTLPDACGAAFVRSKISQEEQAAKIQTWFSLWMRLGWLCVRE
ncbi:MAG: DNA-binding domain-containing protein [Nibricoccus sp.]